LFRSARSIGEWQPFLDMTTDAFQFWVPQGVFAATELNRTRTM
jgi:hypothetical protein